MRRFGLVLVALAGSAHGSREHERARERRHGDNRQQHDGSGDADRPERSDGRQAARRWPVPPVWQRCRQRPNGSGATTASRARAPPRSATRRAAVTAAWSRGAAQGTICSESQGGGEPKRSIVMKVSGPSKLSPGIRRSGLLGIGITLGVSVTQSGDPSGCPVGSTGTVTLFASYYETHVDKASMRFAGACGELGRELHQSGPARPDLEQRRDDPARLGPATARAAPWSGRRRATAPSNARRARAGRLQTIASPAL